MAIQSKVENIPWFAKLETLQEKFENTEPLDYSEIEKELDNYIIALDPDPSSVGLDKLNAKIAAINSYMERIVTIVMNAIANENKFNSLFNDTKMFYEKYLRIQLRSEDVAALSNQNLRQAAAEEKIEDIGKLKFFAEKALNDAKAHTEICREKLKGFEKTDKNISRQLTVIQTQIEIGEIQRKVIGKKYDDNF
jgi:hypothetical protein